MINIFYECKDSNVASYADDTTPYSCATDIPSLPLEVQASATKLVRWFKNNHLKADPGKEFLSLLEGFQIPKNLRVRFWREIFI